MNFDQMSMSARPAYFLEHIMHMSLTKFLLVAKVWGKTIPRYELCFTHSIMGENEVIPHIRLIRLKMIKPSC